ncbi:MAG TPA: CHAT domain-containing protein [Saprospiraceae bacterium]|nr:CHAT domain-containing protein [Saprospiraceae bacterium]HMQ82562.1 CHAT domain-containing protein [Saprospiraceae bacterium]
MRKPHLSLVLALFLSAALFASKDSLLIEEFKQQALTALKTGDEECALLDYENACQLLKTADNLKDWLTFNKEMGKIYYYDFDDHQKALLYFAEKREQAFRQPKNEEEWKYWAELIMREGMVYYYGLEDIEKAASIYEKAKNIFVDNLNIENDFVAQGLYLPLGNLNNRLGDLKRSEIYLEKYIQIYTDLQNDERVSSGYANLSLLYHFAGEPEEAIKTAEKGLNIKNVDNFYKGVLYSCIAEALFSKQDYIESILELEKAHESYNSVEETNKFYKYISRKILELNEILAKNYHRLGQYDKAQEYFQKALDPNTSALSRETGKLYIEWSKLYADEGRFEEALQAINKALQCVLPQYAPQNLLENPSADQFRAENTIMDALTEKANILSRWHQEAGGADKLHSALECHELNFEVEQLLRRTHWYESSKLLSVEEARLRCAHAIEVSLALYRETGMDQFKEKALAFAEQSKSTLMLEAFYKSRAASLADIPQKELDIEHQLQTDIARSEKRLFDLKAGETPDSIIQQTETALLSYKQAYATWVKAIERAYPEYYNLKYNVTTRKISEIREALIASDEAFVEYFVAEKQIYAFVITADRFEVLTLAKDFPLEEWALEFRKDIEAFQHPDSDKTQLCEAYSSKGYELYQRLIEPLEKMGLPKKLIIVPSGVLGLLPFEALLSAPAQSCDFRTYPYLVHEYQIAYAYSASLQYELLQRSGRVNRRFAGFAPVFDGRGGFGELRYNVDLLQQVKSGYGAKLYQDEEATIGMLEQIARKFGVFHFSTHAQANPEEGDFSFIVFSDGQDGYDSLMVKDIYLLPLQAEMVVLSACETALGTVYNGEGIINLPRAFFYAGANSVITTLWSINDGKNRSLMENYYTALKKGKDKSGALQQAKLDYLTDAGKFDAHPAYWAGFVPIGNMRPLYSPWADAVLASSALLAMAGAGMWFWQRKRSKVQKNTSHRAIAQSESFA